MILKYEEFILEFHEHDPRHRKYGVYNSYVTPSPEGSADSGSEGQGCSTPGSSAGASGGAASSGSGGGSAD